MSGGRWLFVSGQQCLLERSEQLDEEPLILFEVN